MTTISSPRPRPFLSRALAGAALALVGGTAAAAPAHDVCVPAAIGVPTKEGPPTWQTWAAGVVVDHNLDDSRWLGSTGHTFTSGSATAPLMSRALWWHDATTTKDYLYLSFIIDLEPNATTPRDLFLGFHRAAAAGTQQGYILQFHLTGAGGAAGGLVVPTYCSTASCAEGGATPKDYWRIYVDNGNTAPDGCDTGSGNPNGNEYDRLPGTSPTTPPIAWITDPDPADPGNTGANLHDKDFVGYWRLDTSAPTALQNRWAVQVRIPLTDSGHPITDGIEKGATFWYEAAEGVTGAPDTYIDVGHWPTALTKSVCPELTGTGILVHQELGNAPANPADCPLCSADKFSALTELTGAPPTTCDGGLTIDHADVGSIFNVVTGTDLTAAHPTNAFGAAKTVGETAVNTVLAQPHNTTTATITAKLRARFRLASWGSGPWVDPSDHGKWVDIRGSQNQRCVPLDAADPSKCDVAPGGKAAIAFDWTIGNDPTIGESEFCQYSLPLPAGRGSCGTCSCVGSEAHAAGKSCYADTDVGTFAPNPGGPTAWPCVSKISKDDQCMQVELDAPNNDVNFVSQSTWNNMTFAPMSIAKREALIDARALPVAPGQAFQDLYLFVVPRNMPATLPAGATGVSLVQGGALAAAQRIAQPYVDDLKRLSPAEIQVIENQLGRGGAGGGYGGSGSGSGAGSGVFAGDGYAGFGYGGPGGLAHDAYRAFLAEHKNDDSPRLVGLREVAAAREIMPDADYVRVGQLLDVAVARPVGPTAAWDLTHAVYLVSNPATTASVVPTLEIYPFYVPFGRGHVYMPMTSFSLFLSHEDALAGIHFEIDGAKKVAENVYHLQIPVGLARRIQVRSQAIVPPEAVEAPGSASWPCGCCSGPRCGTVAVGNTVPGLIAGVFVVGRRRRRKQPARR